MPDFAFELQCPASHATPRFAAAYVCTPGSEGGVGSPIARFADIQDGIGCDVGERMRVLVTLLEA